MSNCLVSILPPTTKFVKKKTSIIKLLLVDDHDFVVGDRVSGVNVRGDHVDATHVTLL
jgi:hypothetical protein